MIKEAQVLNREQLLQALDDVACAPVQVDVFDQLPSTSDYLKEQLRQRQVADGRKPYLPYLCVADWQTQGRGRRGKTWVTQRGNITFSILMQIDKDPSRLVGLSLVTGIAVTETLRSLCAISAEIKWPNDILVNDHKLCGLLTELNSIGSTHSCHVITGIGINYELDRQAQSVNQDYRATSLQLLLDKPPARAQVIATVSANVLSAYERFVQNGWSAFSASWDTLDYLRGKPVTIVNGDNSEYAVANGVDANGALLVATKAGEKTVHSGEVSVRVR